MIQRLESPEYQVLRDGLADHRFKSVRVVRWQSNVAPEDWKRAATKLLNQGIATVDELDGDLIVTRRDRERMARL